MLRTLNSAVGVLWPAGALQPSPLDDLAFSKKPRPVEFQPYSLVSSKDTALFVAQICAPVAGQQ